MNLARKLTAREKSLILVIFVLAGLLLVSSPIQAAYEHLVNEYNDKELYALFWDSQESGKQALALMYLFAYIQNNPDRYANNTNGHAASIDAAFNSLRALVQENEEIADLVYKDIESCNKYPCSDEKAEVGSIGSRGFPWNMVQVCEGYNFDDPCAYLLAGEYTQWEQLGVANDSISSIKVGKDVELTLCVHSLGHTDECLTFGNDDKDLRDNIIPGHGYSIDNNVSTASIIFRPFPGLTPP